MVKAAAETLAKAIQESEAFLNYRALDDALKLKPELKEQLETFQSRQFSLQRAHLMGVTLDEDELKAVDQLFSELVKDPLIEQYFQAELQVNQMMTEVSRILGDAMDFRKLAE